MYPGFVMWSILVNETGCKQVLEFVVFLLGLTQMPREETTEAVRGPPGNSHSWAQ